jgi:hypothetical protein
MPYTHKAVRDNMHGKAAKELPLLELHLLLFSLFAIVFTGKVYVAVFHLFNAVVANRNAMRVAANIYSNQSGLGIYRLLFLTSTAPACRAFGRQVAKPRRS